MNDEATHTGAANIVHLLREQARCTPHAAALIDSHRGRPRTLTFRELDQSAGRMAIRLHQAGLRPGDVVLVFHPMSSELYVILAALLRQGLTAMFIEPSADRATFERCCRLLSPRGLIASSKAHLLRLTSPALRRIPLKFSLGWPIPGAISLNADRNEPIRDDIQCCNDNTPAIVSLTSGSTGDPKPIVRTHGFLRTQLTVLQRSLSLSPGEIELVALPLFVLANLASGMTSILPDADLRQPATIAAAPVIAQLLEQRTTRAAGAPAFFERLLDHCEQHDIVLPGLRRVLTGGGPVTPHLLERLQRICPQARITGVYGATEAEPIATIDAHEISDADRAEMRRGRGLLVGKPVPGLHVRILENRWGSSIVPLTDVEHDRRSLPNEQIGEIVVSGEHVLDGYLHGEDHDIHKYRVGATHWHRTGDAGYFDRHGRLWLMGRCTACIDDERGSLYPFAVEYAALEQPSVVRAALVPHRGQRVLAVQLKGTRSKSDTQELLRMLSFADLDAIRVVAELPVDKRHNSKIDYARLASLLERTS